jgi:hypothetical protein
METVFFSAPDTVCLQTIDTGTDFGCLILKIPFLAVMICIREVVFFRLEYAVSDLIRK